MRLLSLYHGCSASGAGIATATCTSEGFVVTQSSCAAQGTTSRYLAQDATVPGIDPGCFVFVYCWLTADCLLDNHVASCVKPLLLMIIRNQPVA